MMEKWTSKLSRKLALFIHLQLFFMIVISFMEHILTAVQSHSLKSFLQILNK